MTDLGSFSFLKIDAFSSINAYHSFVKMICVECEGFIEPMVIVQRFHFSYNDWGGYNYSRPAPYNVPPSRGQRGRPTPGYGGPNYNDYGGFSSAPKEAVPTESTVNGVL